MHARRRYRHVRSPVFIAVGVGCGVHAHASTLGILRIIPVIVPCEICLVYSSVALLTLLCRAEQFSHLAHGNQVSPERSDRAQSIHGDRRLAHILVHSLVDAAQRRFQMLERLRRLYRQQGRKDGMHVQHLGF